MQISNPQSYFELPGPVPMWLFRLSRATLRALRPGKWKHWDFPDNFWTPHNKSFFEESNFLEAYEFAVNLAGEDYRIPWRIHQAIWAANSTRHLGGDIVELGTGRGFTMAAVLYFLQKNSDDVRIAHLFDTFTQPAQTDIENRRFARVYAEKPDDVISSFSCFPKAKFVVGNIFETLPPWKSEGISFAHVDLNDAEAEVFGVRHLWPMMIPGSILILDDYANRGLEKQFRQLSELFDAFGASILSTPAGQGIVVKPA